MNVNFTEKQRDYITAQIESGDYHNAGEVVREALHLHQLHTQRMVEELRLEIVKGWDSPVSKYGVNDLIEKLGQS